MGKGIALLVGLRGVDPTCYNNWDGTNGCWGCELDVDNIKLLLSKSEYDIETIKTERATHDSILDALGSIADTASEGDLFVFYFSGHGGQQRDTSGDEADRKDETLVAYDAEIIDDELNDIWLRFKRGVRILMMSDSCNSGSNYRLMGRERRPEPIRPIIDVKLKSEMKAELIHFGGCRDGFTSSGYRAGGAFTMALCDVWDNGKFEGNYKQFLDRIAKNVTSSQKPQYNEYGPVTPEFRSQKPFTI